MMTPHSTRARCVAASALTAATLLVLPVSAAQATTTVRYGPHVGPTGAEACVENQRRAVAERGHEATFGGCYEIGPGTDIWYYNGYWPD